MSVLSKMRSWWRVLAHRSTHDREMEAELQLHIDNLVLRSDAPAHEPGRCVTEGTDGTSHYRSPKKRIDPDIIGKQVNLNDIPHTVTGVMPPRFAYPSNEMQPQTWRPVEITSKDQVRDNSALNYSVVAHLRPGVTVNAVHGWPVFGKSACYR